MGEEAFHVYKSLKKHDNSDTLEEIYTFMTNHFVSKRSQFTEAQIFRRAVKEADETIDQYALRLRHLATHCKFSNVDDEILQQLVAGSGMENFQLKCCCFEYRERVRKKCTKHERAMEANGWGVD